MRVRSLVLLAVLLGATPALAAAPSPRQDREVANVAAFARLYGVARWFYPSDAAAALDWNRFAVHGVSRVRPAADDAALRTELLRLFAPLGEGIEVASRLPEPVAATRTSAPLVAWRHLGPGQAGGVPGGPYLSKRTHRTVSALDGFANVMQTVPAEALRGRAIRLRGQVRATVADATGAAALWLRVDRAGGKAGFFDNMGDRPVRASEWRLATIEGKVAEDAVAIAFGAMAFGAVTADFDGIELATRRPDGAWERAPIADGGFEAGASSRGWFRAGTSRNAVVTRPAGGAAQGRQFLRVAPPQATDGAPELFPDVPPVAGDHADVDLGPGLFARVPLSLRDEQARVEPGRRRALDALLASLAALPGPSPASGPDEGLADVVVAWNVFRHFYPYWPETGVAWDARLVPLLEAARPARTREERRTALRRLVAEARDGHGFVGDTLDGTPRGSLPVRLAVVEGRLVVVASGSAALPVGAEVVSVGGVPAASRLAETARLSSGTERWRNVQAALELATGPVGRSVALEVDDGRGRRAVTLDVAAAPPPVERRPAAVAELEKGLWYVDLTRATMAELKPRLDALGRARGVVFDLRGYPGDAGAAILPHLLTAPESGRWMHVPRIVGPFFRTKGWNSFGWNAAPAAPRIAGPAVFLTDARAISYAESVLGYVADRKLGTIVGAPTAGTNGNVASFTTPGGFAVGFTGMRVTRHDGTSPHHLAGVRPDVAAAPTVAGLRAGRDEVLEKGLAVVREATTRPRR